MICSLCGQPLQRNLPYVPFITWKGKTVGECCYDEILHTLKAESLTGDASLLYNFEGIFSDDENGRYHITQEVLAGPANMGYAKKLTIKKL